MPTASQCLILMTDEGCEQRLSKRRYSGVNTNVSMPNIIPSKGYNTPEYGNDSGQDSQFPSLFNPNVGPYHRPYALIVHGFKGTMSYNSAAKSFRWQIESKDSPHQIKQKISANINSLKNTDTMGYQKSAFVHTPAFSNCLQDDIPQNNGVDGKSYKCLENLGFRRRQKRRSTTDKKLDIDDNKKQLTGILKDAKYVPTPPGQKPIAIDNPQTDDRSSGDSSNGVNEKTACIDIKSKGKPVLLLEEVKRNVDYYDRVLPAMHLRRTPPESNPTKVCFSVKRMDISHEDIKTLIESQTGHDVISIQYDPVSIRAGSDTGSRWIVSFLSSEACEHVVRTGLMVNEEKVVIKYLDEIQLLEYTAFLAKCEEEKNKSMKYSSVSAIRATNWTTSKAVKKGYKP